MLFFAKLLTKPFTSCLQGVFRYICVCVCFLFVFYGAFTRPLQGYYKAVTRLLRSFHQAFTRRLQGVFCKAFTSSFTQFVYDVFLQGLYNVLTRNLQCFFKAVTRTVPGFQWAFTKLLQGFCKAFARCSQCLFDKVFTRRLQSCCFTMFFTIHVTRLLHVFTRLSQGFYNVFVCEVFLHMFLQGFYKAFTSMLQCFYKVCTRL